MTTDDFALYSQLAPSLYFKLGVCGTPDGCPPLHSSDFDVDETSIRHGVDVLTTVTHHELGRPATRRNDGGNRHAGA